LGDEGIAPDEESQVSFCPMTGVFHTHPRPFDYCKKLGFGWLGYVEIVTEQVVSVQAPVNVHRTAKETGTLATATNIHHRLNCAQQDGARISFWLGHYVHAVIVAID
jgi:hypothetical protein